MAKPKDSPIHLKFDYMQAKDAKRDLLSSQLNLLKISQSIENYKELRKKELENKEKIKSKIKLLKTNLTNLEKNLPKIVLPKILKRDQQVVEIEKPSQKMAIYGTIEDQLKEIQRKLKELE